MVKSPADTYTITISSAGRNQVSPVFQSGVAVGVGISVGIKVSVGVGVGDGGVTEMHALTTSRLPVIRKFLTLGNLFMGVALLDKG